MKLRDAVPVIVFTAALFASITCVRHSDAQQGTGYTPPVMSDPMRANTWQSRTSGSDLVMKDSAGNVLGTMKDNGTTGRMLVNAIGPQTAAANQPFDFYADDASSVLTNYLSLNVTGLTFQNGANSVIGPTSANLVMQPGSGRTGTLLDTSGSAVFSWGSLGDGTNGTRIMNGAQVVAKIKSSATALTIDASGTVNAVSVKAPGNAGGHLTDSAGTNQLDWGTTGVYIGGGGAITKVQKCTSTTDVANITAQSCLLTTLASVSGCTPTSNSLPTNFLPSQPINGVICTPNNSAGTMQVYCCNVTAGALNPPSTTFVVGIIDM